MWITYFIVNPGDIGVRIIRKEGGKTILSRLPLLAFRGQPMAWPLGANKAARWPKVVFLCQPQTVQSLRFKRTTEALSLGCPGNISLQIPTQVDNRWVYYWCCSLLSTKIYREVTTSEGFLYPSLDYNSLDNWDQSINQPGYDLL